MKYLIDTHVFLWLLFDDEKLSENSRTIIRDIKNDIYISVISFWEISLKYALQKLKLKNIRPEDLPSVTSEIEVDILNLSPRDASTFYKLPKLKHKDPFDRLIIWQAINNDLILLSKDSMVSEYKQHGLKTEW